MTGGTQAYSPRYDSYTSDEYPPDWQARRQQVLKRDEYTCQQCGLRSTRVDDVRFDVDHIVPKSEGGSHGLENLQTLCPRCHANKHPGNSKLEKRSREFKHRNKPPLLIQFVWLVLGPFIESIGPDEQTVFDEQGRRLHLHSLSEAATLEKGVGVTVDVTVTELWNSNSDNVHQMGKVHDGTNNEASELEERNQEKARFVVWTGNRHPRLQEGRTYRIVGAKTNTYNGEFQLVVDGRSAIQAL